MDKIVYVNDKVIYPKKFYQCAHWDKSYGRKISNINIHSCCRHHTSNIFIANSNLFIVSISIELPKIGNVIYTRYKLSIQSDEA